MPELVRHNHFTRDIKSPGICPACDRPLDDAIRQAKITAGLDPNYPARPADFIDSLPQEWQRPFMQRQIHRALAEMSAENPTLKGTE
ncbi:hypothetical protein [Marisediminicola sp. LYQ134]|uniref:hypothetical protein n=1 Tax=Marisediminicola sp. LYQ134 TaxID=3391061 RepID=UPI00398360F1